MAIRRIIQSDLSGGDIRENEALHKVAKYVDTVDEYVCSVINDLRDTLWAYPFCVGLSAPQIGEDLAISVVNSNRDDRNNDLIMINPKAISITGKKDRKRESCMSVWGKIGEVERRDKLIVSYMDEKLEEKRISCTGFMSRTIQHEMDHLNGILYIDKLIESSSLQHADFFDEYTILDSEEE